MKGYLFGLGAMLVGAGLMFVLMHGEVSADSKPEEPEPLVCSAVGTMNYKKGHVKDVPVIHCQNQVLTCAWEYSVGLSCVKR